MECEKCGKEIDPGTARIEACCYDGINIEVVMECPHCKARYVESFDVDIMDLEN